MKLYHGTGADLLDTVKSVGLRPRGEGVGNYEKCPSHPEAVYLTNSYAIHYGTCYMQEAGSILVVEVDSDCLEEHLLAPDEDFLEQATRNEPDFNDIGSTMEERTKWFRERAWSEYNDAWMMSLIHLGTCAYYDRVSPECITRIAVIPQGHVFQRASDPTITLMNYKIMGPFYRNLTKWVFGDGDFEKDVLGRFSKDELPRDGIQVIEMEKVDGV